MSDNEHIIKLKAVRQILVERRREYAKAALEFQKLGDARWPNSIVEVVSCQKQVAVIDEAIADETAAADADLNQRGFTGY